MEVVLAVLVALALAASVGLRLRRRRPEVDPALRAELDALGAALLAEHRDAVRPVLSRRLSVVLGRRVPASSVEATGVRGQYSLRFADETTVLVRERRPGDMALLGLQLLTRRVNLASYEFGAEGAWLEVVWAGGGLRVLAVA